MKKRMIIISDLHIWDMKNNAGREVMFKTINYFSRDYDIILISPDQSVAGLKIKQHFFFNLNILNKYIGIKYFGYILKNIYMYLYVINLKKIIKKNQIDGDLFYTVGYMSANAIFKIYKNRKPVFNRHLGIAWKPEKFNQWFYRLKNYAQFKSIRNHGVGVIMTNDGTQGDKFLERINIPQELIFFKKNGINKNYEINVKEIEKIKENNGIDEETHVFLTVSRLVNWKRVDLAIKLMREVVSRNPNSKLLIVGDGKEKAKLKEQVKEYKLENNIKFQGAISRDEIHNYFAIADFFFSFYDYSNAGNPLFEAMMHSKCIFVKNVGDTVEFISGNQCVLLTEKEILENNSKIFDVIENEELKKQKEKEAFKRFNEDFQTWEERIKLEIDFINERYESFYNKPIAEKSLC